MDLAPLEGDEDDSFDLEDEPVLWTGSDISSFGNSVMEHQSNGWRENCTTFWRAEKTKRLIGAFIIIVVLMSIVMIAVGGSKMGSGPDQSLLPWIGVIMGLILLILCGVGGVLFFRRDLFGRIEHL